jgi:hypothetical protein
LGTPNGPENFFKHVDSDPDAVLDTVNEEFNDAIALVHFEALAQPRSDEMEAYRT